MTGTSEKGDKDRQRRFKSFARRSRAAAAGIHLPTYLELLKGSPCMGGDLRQDAQAFAERLLPKIRLDLPSGAMAHEKVKALTLLPLIVDYRAAATALQVYSDEHLNTKTDFEECARRCILYAAASGCAESAFATAKFAVHLGNDILAASDETYDFIVAALGWMILAVDYLPGRMHAGGGSTFAVRTGKHLSLKLVDEHNRRKADEDTNLAKDRDDSPPVETAFTSADGDIDAPASSGGISVVVLKEIGNADVGSGKPVAKEFAKIIGKDLPVTPIPDLQAARDTLAAEFPHAVTVIDYLIAGLVGQPYVKFKPTILLGSPGSGKTAFAARFFRCIGVPCERYSCGGVSDSSFAGTARRWSTGEPSLPLSLVRRFQCASPGIVLDEVEKVATSDHNGNLLDALLGLLEPESSAEYFDPYVQGAADLSRVLWLATANGLSPIPGPLRDRCRVISFPDPGPEHLKFLAPRVLARLVTERGLDERWATPLDGWEIEILAQAWRGGSLRQLQRFVEIVFLSRGMDSQLH